MMGKRDTNADTDTDDPLTAVASINKKTEPKTKTNNRKNIK
jgi:hypothetical protein